MMEKPRPQDKDEENQAQIRIDDDGQMKYQLQSVSRDSSCEVKKTKLKQNTEKNCHCFVLWGQAKWGCKCCYD